MEVFFGLLKQEKISLKLQKKNGEKDLSFYFLMGKWINCGKTMKTHIAIEKEKGKYFFLFSIKWQQESIRSQLIFFFNIDYETISLLFI